MSASVETNNYLETENLGKLMWKYALPCIISMLVAAFYNIVDQIFIANASYLGSYGNAANTVVFPMTVVAIAIAVMFGDGCCTFVSISLGSRERSEAADGVGNTVMSVAAVSLALTAVYLAFQSPILRMFGADVSEETFRLSKEYFFWITLGIPFYMFGQAMNPIIRSDGSPRFSMATLLAGAVFNIIFDPICIYWLKWGMMGAAVATIGGQILSAAMAAAYLFRMKATPLNKSCFVFQPRLVKKVAALGFASFFSQFAIVFSMAATINMAVKYGLMDAVFGRAEYAQIPTAVVGIVSKFFQIVISVSVGLAAGCIPIAGYNIGAKRGDRVLELMKRLMAAEALLGLTASVIFLLFPDWLMLIFGSEKESAYYTNFAVWFIRGQLCLLPFACLNKGSFIFLQSLGKAKESSVLSVIREFVFGVGFTLALPMVWGLYALPLFMPTADAATFIAVAAALLRVKKELEKPAAEEAPERGTEKFVPSSAPALTDYIITIGRSYGAGGRSVGRQLAEKLNVPYYDAALLEETAKYSGLNRKYLASMDERSRKSKGLYQYWGFGCGHDGSLENLADQAQQEVIKLVAAQGPCVIVGRRADQILRGNGKLLSLFIRAPAEARVRRVSERDGISASESEQKILKADRERAAYYSQYSGAQWGAAGTYDICLDTSKLGVEGVVEVVADALDKLKG